MDYEENKDMFLLEVQKLHFKLDSLIKEYGMEDVVVSVMMTGIVDFDDYQDPVMKAIYSYSLESRESLEEVVEFIVQSYDNKKSEKQEGFDLDDILGDLGISLN
jgi:hypothetical protein